MFNQKKKRFPVFAVVICVLIFLFHYSGFISLSIKTATPFLFLPLLVTTAMFYGETAGLFFGLFAGLLIDTADSMSHCYNTIFFSFAGFAIGLLAAFVFNSNIRASAALSVITAFVYFCLKWLIFYFIMDVEGKIHYLLRYSLPSAFYTAFFVLPFYFAERYIKQRYEKKKEKVL